MDLAVARRKPRQIVLPLVVAALLQGCATQSDIAVTPIGLYETSTALAAGQLRLNCDLGCYGSWGAARGRARGLFEAQVWPDLAFEVMRVGFRSDQTYFYLARAAEGLGKNAAADVYYRMALGSDRRCDGLLLNSCDGIDIQAQAKAGLKRVQ